MQSVASQGYNATGAIANRFLSSALSGALSVGSERVKYAANEVLRITIPEAGELISLLARDMILYNDAQSLLSKHGIDMSVNAWDAVLTGAMSWPSPQDAIKAYWRDQARYSVPAIRWVKSHGFTDGNVMHYMWNTPVSWSAEHVRILRRLGTISPGQSNDWLKAAGIILQEDRDCFEALRQPMGISEAMVARNREILTDAEFREYLNLNGYANQGVEDQFDKLRFNIPGPSDLIEFAVKEAWNDQIVQKFGYDDEFNQIPEFNFWMDKQGYGGSPNYPNGGANQPQTWAQAYWRAHWRVISNEQAYNMLHRLRPTGGNGGGPRVPFVPGTNTPVGPVTIQDVEAVLKVNDYPPFWRDKLASLSFAVLRLVDIRRIVRLSLGDANFKTAAIGNFFSIKDWAKENYLDRGQTPADANTLAEMALYDAQYQLDAPKRRRQRAINARIVRNLQSQYSIGLLDKTATKSQLATYGYTSLQQEQLVTECDVENEMRCANLNIARIRKDFLKGEIDEATARTKLATIGIIQPMIDFYIRCWKGTISTHTVHQHTTGVLSLLRQGIISANSAKARLTNLGWSNADALIEVARIQADMNRAVEDDY